MAHGVKQNATLTIHQTLHGYTDGHRQIATSVTLTPRDIKTMLVLSDVSGPGINITDNGYLTGYPLAESKMYALARTWAAPEMPRPGCVWTHTLLIDFTDLATLAAPESVMSLFRRPSMGNNAGYGTSLQVPTEQSYSEISHDAVHFVRQLMASLYGYPHSPIIATLPTALDVDSVVIALWAQQWPRLRRTFRFCTLSASDRSSDLGKFDLQLISPIIRGIRSRFRDAIDASDTKAMNEDWLDDAVLDLQNVDVNGLRTFLRLIGGDVDSGRKAFRSLCRLHVLIGEFGTTPKAIDNAISVIEEELTSAQARTARGLVTNAALQHLDIVSDSAIDFVLRHLQFAEQEIVSNRGGTLGREVWMRIPDRFSELLDSSDLHRAVAVSGFAALDVDEVAEGIARVPRLSTIALEHHAELVTKPKFWLCKSAPIDQAFKVLTQSPAFQNPGIAAMIAARRDDLATRAVHEFGSLCVLQVLSGLFESTTGDERRLDSWLSAALTDRNAVAQFLADEKNKPWALLSAIAHILPPDAVPNEHGVDPWAIAGQSLGAKSIDDESLYLYAYLLSRAFGPSSRSPGELVILSFEPLHVAASTNQLKEDAWQLIEYRLPWSANWFSWDRCQRIRAAVCELFVRLRLHPQLFVQITSDDGLFAAMAETIARKRRGQYFLRDVFRWMKNADAPRGRIRVVEDLID